MSESSRINYCVFEFKSMNLIRSVGSAVNWHSCNDVWLEGYGIFVNDLANPVHTTSRLC